MYVHNILIGKSRNQCSSIVNPTICTSTDSQDLGCYGITVYLLMIKLHLQNTEK